MATTRVLLAAALTLQAATAFPLIGMHHPHHVRPILHSVPAVDTPAPHRELHIAVKQKNEDRLEELLVAVSTPGGALYGRHLSLDDVCALFSPEAASVDAVLEWAAAHGASNVRRSRCGDFVTVSMPAASLPRAFAGTQGLECSEAGHGCNLPIAVPPSLAHAVDFIDGIGSGARTPPRSAPAPREYNPAARREKAGAAGVGAEVGGEGGVEKKKGPWYPKCLASTAVPPCLKELHNVTVNKGTSSDSSQGVALFGYQFYSPSDLAEFQKEYKVPHIDITDLNDNDPTTPGTEASLDVQYISGLGAGIQTWYMHYKCTTQECHPFLTWIQQIGNTTNPPLVQSVSVGTTEYEYVGDYGEKYVRRINQEFMKAGVRGISLLFATGDRASQIYESKYWINFPSASPHVTAVGGVWLGELGGGPMEVDPDTTGGFSNCDVHARPKYQDSAVENYLKEAASEAAKQPPVFNASNRGVPDLVSMSDAYVIIQHGSPTFVGGTSAACPVVAGVMSLINDARLAAGKPSLGFLNPFLYANPQCFEDIVSGSNLYGATEGWDPASGLGTPAFACLLKAAMAIV
eukprot:CAMPEP_0206229260 /NCGR_PEP_ID=MMETSP0047_2-20121206/9602_1 /ASSEMBLY_ACC=CAM_ASM_000192 /TAXON_ID=195065 /ORGANISM="Chroomonas mesostigmatica_cf, Strain CCMP1168" /LENGTH=574 /DNA_ID=CAMNT_0053652547 /DNA_START=45 /DNA_END=1769 /DNA_ORIENTATION=-